jgi:hypothetical protein
MLGVALCTQTLSLTENLAPEYGLNEYPDGTKSRAAHPATKTHVTIKSSLFIRPPQISKNNFLTVVFHL